jgi:D-alanyl-D-alanine carboxypeptidase/D-alanyl-D-alanine-endopeptidase (penicillin-binding protein 4)
MPLRTRLFASLLLLVSVPATLQARDRPYLPPEVEHVLTQRRVPGTSLSVLVREVGRDEPVVSYNSQVPRNPASTMKVLTTYAALEILGPAYTWRTRAYAAGPVQDQVLDGNLVLVGGGDPFMTADRWWGFVNGLRGAGIERVTGDLVIDNSYFAPQGDDRGAFDNRPYRTYNVLPDALMVNSQTVTLSVIPDIGSGSVRASANPWPANLVIDNSVKLDKGACRRGSGGVVVAMPDGAMGNRVSLTGRYASGCGPLSVTRVVMRPPDYAFGTFKTFWQQTGGTLNGGMRLGVVPADARLLYTHDSVSLAEVIRLINKYSSNVMARHLMLTLAAEKAGSPGTTAAGRQVIVDFLASRGISIPDLVLENGSGLSREERITAAGLGDVLLAAWRSPYMPEFAASLPLSATDGTLRRRFRAPEMQGRLRMKTGSLNDVSALAGYVNAASGRTYVTVVILNHPLADAGVGEAVQAALVQWVFGQ